MIRRFLLVPALAAAVLAAGCSEDTTPTTAPETPVLLSETVTGTVTVSGGSAQPFTVNRAGTVTAQITALAPDDTVVVGFSLGTWNGAACQVVIANDAAKLSTAIIGTATAPGTLCVRVYDVGGLTTPTSYDVKVDHY